MERTPMRRDTAGARSFRSGQRKPINKVSTKQKRKNDAWSVLRAAVLLRDPNCRFHGPGPFVFCGARSVDAHHVQTKGRGGADTLDNCIGLCRRHHDWVHDNGVAAEKLGLLKHGWDD